MNIKAVKFSEFDALAKADPRMEIVGTFMVNGFLKVFVTKDADLWHLSVSHPRRYPTWDEIRDIRYALLPGDKTFAILFPPRDQYVNVHPNCFHLHEVPELHEA